MNPGRTLRQALCAMAACAALAAQAGPLRICADPDNLPFSKADGPEKGLYLELAELVSRRIGETPEYVWWLTYNQRRALRNTILQDGCDAYFALPADADYRVRGLQRTRAFLDVSYAIVAPPGLQVSGLADLQGRRVGVLHGSPPHILMATRQGYTTTSFRENDEALAALAQGGVDVAVLWGPSAGYENARRFGNRWQVLPVTGEGLGGQVAVAVRRGSDDLARRIDEALLALQPQIEELARKYGFPRGKPLPLSVAREPAGRATALASSLRVGGGWVPTQAAAAAPEGVKAGRSLFNNVCSHCHGTDGASPVSERDLRRLKARYKDQWRDSALGTIRNGRVDAGMPAWRSTYNDQQIDDVLGFLATIQR